MTINLFSEHLKHAKAIYRDANQFDEFKQTCLFLHSLVHVSGVGQLTQKSYEDELWQGLTTHDAKTAVNEKGRTVVYGMWHASRIEDITVNLLVAEQPQILDEQWLARIGSPISDTGNQLTQRELLSFSQMIDVDALRAYRQAVGFNTQKILSELEFSDLQRRFSSDILQGVFQSHAVAQHPDSEWLVEFWGKKNVAGIIFMPVTRHNLLHINESKRAKAKARGYKPRLSEEKESFDSGVSI